MNFNIRCISKLMIAAQVYFVNVMRKKLSHKHLFDGPVQVKCRQHYRDCVGCPEARYVLTGEKTPWPCAGNLYAGLMVVLCGSSAKSKLLIIASIVAVFNIVAAFQL